MIILISEVQTLSLQKVLCSQIFKGWGGGREAGKYGVFTVTIRDGGLVQDQWLRLQGFFLRCVTTSRLFL